MIEALMFCSGAALGALVAGGLVRDSAEWRGYLRGYRLGKSMEFSFWLLTHAPREPLEGETPSDYPGSRR